MKYSTKFLGAAGTIIVQMVIIVCLTTPAEKLAYKRTSAAETRIANAEARIKRITDKIAAEQKAITDKIAAEQKAIADKIAAEQKAAADKIAAEQKAIADKIAAEQKAAANQPEVRVRNDNNYRFDVTYAAEQAVKDVLKSPGTAVFPQPFFYTVMESPNHPHHLLVAGYIDAQNSFGGLMRANWLVELELKPNASGLGIHDWLTTVIEFDQKR
jgi:hypothetical protein